MTRPHVPGSLLCLVLSCSVMIMPEMWFRNPSNYVRELIECNEGHMIFDYGFCVKRNITEPRKWADMYYGLSGRKYRLIVAGAQGGAEYRSHADKPVAVYPVFEYGDSESILESYMASNVGSNSNLVGDTSVDILSRPVAGQEHRVIVMNFPDLNTGPGKKFLTLCRELQEEYPDVILHLHGATVFSTPIRLGFRAVDWDPRTPAAHGTICLPTGKKVDVLKGSAVQAADWIKLLGYKLVELQDARTRCMFNIKAAQWAGQNYTKDLRIVPRNKLPIDTTTPDANYDPEVNNSLKFHNVAPKPGDRFVCNECSLAMTCKYYREGSVCSVPASEPLELTKFFKTRDAQSILDGLQGVLQINAERAMQGLQAEPDFGLDPEVTRILANISKDGEKLAKLVDPSLRNPKVQVNVGSGNTTHVSIADPRQFITGAIRELEQQGIPRNQITPAMIEGILDRAGAERRTEQENFDNARVIENIPHEADHVQQRAMVPVPSVPVPVYQSE